MEIILYDEKSYVFCFYSFQKIETIRPHVCTINIDFVNGNDIFFIKFYRTFYNFVWTGYLSAERSELFGIKT